MNIVIYARYAGGNLLGSSIEQQLTVCRKFAEENNYTIVGEYIDLASSGMTDKRPEFQRMIADSRKKQFQAVLVYRLDRFSRSRYDSAYYKNMLKKNGVRVVSACEHIPDDPSGVMIEAVLEAMAEYYSLDLSRKIKKGIQAKKMRKQKGGENDVA